MLSTLANKKIV